MSEESPTRLSEEEAITLLPRQQILKDLKNWIHEGHDPREGSDSKSPCTLTLVKGAAGLGKSRLIHDALTTEAVDTDLPLLCCRVQCHERQGIPFLPVLRLIKDLILQSGEESALWRRYAHVLARVFLNFGRSWVRMS